ncbi:MAG: hypothetical protein HY554_02115 [Elusimicrobia bacterium]|nr:hypothetical protein [Elusimicrobiota bacterium]
MATKPRANQTYPRIVIGVPDIQKQLLLVDRLAQRAGDAEREPLETLATFLADLYSRLQHQKNVTIYRFGSKTRSGAD